MRLLDDPDRFREKLDDVFLIYWMTDVFRYGPTVLRHRLGELLDPPTIATIATGPHPVQAANLIHILPEETIARASDWLATHWHELDEDVAKDSLDRLAEVAPEVAERLAIEHVARVGDKLPEDTRDLVCVRAIGQGRSEEGLVVGQRLVDRFLAGSRPALKASLFGLCLKRDLPGGPAVILQELRLARDKRRRGGCLRRLLDLVSGPLDFEFVVDHVIIRHEPSCLTDLRPLIDPRADLKELVRILRRRTSTPVPDLIAWACEVFGPDDRSTPTRLLQEASGEHGLDLELVTLATCMFLTRLVVKNPSLEDLSLDRLVRIVSHPIDLCDLARPLADRLRAFPADHVLRTIQRFVGPGDEPDPLARYNTLAILRELALPESFDMLVDQLGREPDDPAVGHGVDGLVALGPAAAERLVHRFGDVTPDVQVQACRVVAKTGGPAAHALVQNWLPRSIDDLRAELCDIIKFWPEASYVALLEPAEPGKDLSANDALVMMELIHGIASPRTPARREELLKEGDSFVHTACPHCGHDALADGDAHPDNDEEEDEDGEELAGDVEGQPTSPRPVRASVQVGRNEPCPCGSGKKFKKCCLGKAVG